MNKRPTRNDVAQLAGVSVATVSYVVNNGPRPVSEETRARVLAAIEELGYRPHAIARSLRTGNTRTIGLLIASLLPSFVGRLVNAVEDNLARRNYGLILASSHEDGELEKRMLEVLADQSIDGLLYIPTSSNNGEKVERLINEGIPVVFIDRLINGVPADAVMTDNVNAAKRATEYLIKNSCCDIICVSFSDEASSALDRVEGYRQALCEQGLPVEEHKVLVVKYASGEDVDASLERYIDAHGLPDGILCASDSFLTSTIKTLHMRGIKIPEQVRVTGGFTASTSPWHELLESPPPLVCQDFQGMAQKAVEFMMERLSGDDRPPRTELIDAEFIIKA